MRVLGIDPGIAIVGYGIIDFENSCYKAVEYGAVTTTSGLPLSTRLNIIFTELTQIIDKYKPDIICYNKIIVELKAVKQTAPEHEAQLINYLKATDMKTPECTVIANRR